MLSDQELEQLADDMESDRVERKESFSGGAKDKIAQAICAHSNDLPAHGRPGVIFVGIDDDVLAENHRSIDEQLAALHLLAPTREANHAAILLLGKDPRAWIPGAYIQFVRFDGAGLDSQILDQKELHGRLSDVLRRVDDLVALNIRVETQVVGTVIEQRRPDYPAAALHQLLRNAVLHRTYEIHAPVYCYWFSDRVEIHSPGGLYGRVNGANFGQPGATDYRNATLAEGLKVLGFVQRFGMGLELARQRCAQNGNPPPEFTFSTSAVLATVWRHP